jgi:hypothetical protein
VIFAGIMVACCKTMRSLDIRRKGKLDPKYTDVGFYCCQVLVQVNVLIENRDVLACG